MPVRRIGASFQASSSLVLPPSERRRKWLVLVLAGGGGRGAGAGSRVSAGPWEDAGGRAACGGGGVGTPGLGPGVPSQQVGVGEPVAARLRHLLAFPGIAPGFQRQRMRETRVRLAPHHLPNSGASCAPKQTVKLQYSCPSGLPLSNSTLLLCVCLPRWTLSIRGTPCTPKGLGLVPSPRRGSASPGASHAREQAAP